MVYYHSRNNPFDIASYTNIRILFRYVLLKDLIRAPFCFALKNNIIV